MAYSSAAVYRSAPSWGYIIVLRTEQWGRGALRVITALTVISGCLLHVKPLPFHERQTISRDLSLHTQIRCVCVFFQSGPNISSLFFGARIFFVEKLGLVDSYAWAKVHPRLHETFRTQDGISLVEKRRLGEDGRHWRGFNANHTRNHGWSTELSSPTRGIRVRRDSSVKYVWNASCNSASSGSHTTLAFGALTFPGQQACLWQNILPKSH